MQLGLKTSCKDTQYTERILSLFNEGIFQYIELFIIPQTFNDFFNYWKSLSIPIIIHAPHSYAGMNLSLIGQRDYNKSILEETFRYADILDAEYIIFHSGLDGNIDETINQLRPFADSRCLVENKPAIGLNDEKCIGSIPEEIKHIMRELNCGFCLDFGHAICAANTHKYDPFEFINSFMDIIPSMFHLTDGDYKSEYDSHLHYKEGDYPLSDIINLIPDNAKVTNEAKNDKLFTCFISDAKFLLK